MLGLCRSALLLHRNGEEERDDVIILQTVQKGEGQGTVRKALGT